MDLSTKGLGEVMRLLQKASDTGAAFDEAFLVKLQIRYNAREHMTILMMMMMMSDDDDGHGHGHGDDDGDGDGDGE